MPSSTVPLPSKDNDYLPPQGTRLDEATWNAVIVQMARDIKALEAQRVEVQAVIDELRLFGLQRLDTALQPLIDEKIAQLAQVQTDIDVALGRIADMEEQIASLLQGAVPAETITESADRVFVTTAQRDLISSTKARVDAILLGAQATADTFAEISTILGKKADLVDGKVPANQLPIAERVWTQIAGPTNVAGVAFVEFTLPAGLDEVRVDYSGLSHDNAAVSRFFALQLYDGATLLLTRNITSTAQVASYVSGTGLGVFKGLSETPNALVSCYMSSGSDFGVMATYPTKVRISVSGGSGNFDAGSVSVSAR